MTTRHIRFLPPTVREIMNRSRDVRLAVLKAAVQGAEDLEKRAKRNLTSGRPYINRRKGGLVNATRAVVKQGVGNVTAVLEFPRIPGLVLNDGALIRPRKGKYLSFRLENGQFVRVRQVRIPARRWASDALEEAGKRMPVKLRDALEERLGRAV